MPDLRINGFSVNFPYEPYSIQRNFISKVLETLEGSHNAVLESPTGTGKTLCLLCSSLAWLSLKKSQTKMKIDPDNAPPKIVYASRTHLQLSQSISAMKATAYSGMKAVTIGSRDQLCIHPDLATETGDSKRHMCRAYVQAGACGFRGRVDLKKNDPDFQNTAILDIEDLIQAGKKHKCCPYYLSKEIIKPSDIIFMPYNYLLDLKITRLNNFQLRDSIIILDEAHNVEKMCEESASIELKTSDLIVCMKELNDIIRMKGEYDAKKKANSKIELSGYDPTFTVEQLNELKVHIFALKKEIDELKVDFEQGTTFIGTKIFNLLEKASFRESSFEFVRKLLDDAIHFVFVVTQGKNTSFHHLSHFSNLLTIIFAEHGEFFHERVRRSYKLHIGYEKRSIESISTSTPVINGKVVSYWCFNPGFAMMRLHNQHVRSVILTSGTLTPFEPLISELRIPVKVRLVNPHIIKKSQIYVRIVSHGSDNVPLISNYDNRNNNKYVVSLGRTIMEFARVIPGGLLVFFSSYINMEKFINVWRISKIWDAISEVKEVFIEPRSKDEFVTVLNAYYLKVQDLSGKGAIFMAVCRGKVSEGLDFADLNGRGVIITGLPFPPINDKRVVLKKTYLQENRACDNSGSILSGSEWYELEAMRAINQAVGRVIRHKDDYGAILLCDKRFNDRRHKESLSTWIQDNIQQSYNPGVAVIKKELQMFFQQAESSLHHMPSTTLVHGENTEVLTKISQNVILSDESFDQGTSSSTPKTAAIPCIKHL